MFAALAAEAAFVTTGKQSYRICNIRCPVIRGITLMIRG